MNHLALLLCAAGLLKAQDATGLQAILQRLFDTKDFTAKSFGPAHWTDQGAGYTTVEPSASNSQFKDIVRYDTASGQREILVSSTALTLAGAASALAIDGYQWSHDRKRLLIFTNTSKVWRDNTRGDYWTLDRGNGRLRQLGAGAPPSSLMFAKFSPDGKHAAYVRANNIYVEDVDSGAIQQITKDGSATLINGTSDWVYEEELSVRDCFRWSPDGKRIAYWQFDSTGVGSFPLTNSSDTLYPVTAFLPYPKVGTTNSAVRIGVISMDGGSTQWMDVPGDPRNHYLARMEWDVNSEDLVLQHLNRLQNTNDVLLANARSGAVRRIFRDEDKAWVDVAGGPLWLRNATRFTWLSERDGWRRAYLVSRDGKRVTPVTPPKTDVVRLVSAAAQGQWLYYTASPGNATQRYLYRSRTDGSGATERLTPQSLPGTHSYEISPNAEWAFHTYSTFDRPPTTDLVHLPDHSTRRVLEDNAALLAAAAPLVSPPVEFFQLGIGEGVTLDGWMLKPRKFDPSRKYPLLMYVYGEPAGTTVNDGWNNRNSLFHRVIANEGYIVASVDNRGTPAPKGRDWRKIIYGEVGVLSSREQADAVLALLQSRPYLDSDRVAVWGWSGGGSNTLNAMLRYPGIYKLGMAVAPVPDQTLYDTIYQERYMGLPKDNAEGYRKGSPITFAEGLKGKLLLVHGSGDDNVHYQGTERLINRLITLGKPFDMMVYPNRSHSISEGKGTSLHLHSLLVRYLTDHIPPGPR